MVKRLPFPAGYDKPFVLLVTRTLSSEPYTIMWNLVHEYSADYQWLLGGGFFLGNFPTDAEEAAVGRPPLYTAHLAALGYAAQNQVVTDASPLTHGSLWQGFQCPTVPRWNIYHGMRGEPLVPCFYWDELALDPPPGYLWYYP